MGLHKDRFTLENLPEDWEALVAREMGEGAAVCEVLKLFGISRKVHDRFLKEYPEYREAFDDGFTLSEAWWSQQVRMMIREKVNPALLIFTMKARFKWRDNHDNQKVKVNIFSDGSFAEKYKVKQEKEAEKTLQ